LCSRVLPDFYTQRMAGLKIDTEAFGIVFEASLPELHAHFVTLEVTNPDKIDETKIDSTCLDSRHGWAQNRRRVTK